MKTLDKIMEQFTGDSILAEMADLFRKHDKEFFDDEVRYLAAVAALKKAKKPNPKTWFFIKQYQNNINIPFPQIVINQPSEKKAASAETNNQSARDFVEEQKELSKTVEEKVE